MYRSGKLKPPYLNPERITDPGGCLLRCNFGNSAGRAGVCIYLHWVGVSVQQAQGYASFGRKCKQYDRYASNGARAEFLMLPR
jgi:hypothetical protein